MTIALSTVASVVSSIEDFMATKSNVGPAVGGGAKVPHFLGSAAASGATNAERIVWVPKTRKEQFPVTGQVDEGHVCAEKDTGCLVTCYASDFARLEQVVDQLTATLEELLSGKAYAFDGEGQFGEPQASNDGYSFARRIVLRAPVFADIWVQGHVTTTTLGVGVVRDSTADPPETPETI